MRPADANAAVKGFFLCCALRLCSFPFLSGTGGLIRMTRIRCHPPSRQAASQQPPGQVSRAARHQADRQASRPLSDQVAKQVRMANVHTFKRNPWRLFGRVLPHVPCRAWCCLLGKCNSLQMMSSSVWVRAVQFIPASPVSPLPCLKRFVARRGVRRILSKRVGM